MPVFSDPRAQEIAEAYGFDAEPRPSQGDRQAANRQELARTLLEIAPVSGEASALRDAWQASGRGGQALSEGDVSGALGDYGDLALALAGAFPGAGIIARGTRRGSAWMDRNLPEGVNRVLDAMYPSDPKNTASIFAGPTARTADKEALTRAREMETQGINPDEIWRETGWGRGADGEWRFEISDEKTHAVPLGSGEEVFQGPMRSAFSHSDLYKAYPEAADIHGVITRKPFYYGDPTTAVGSGRARGAYIEPNETVPQGAVIARTPDARSPLLHELQHDVQRREGFSQGGDPGLTDYQHLAGEVEARNVGARRNLTGSQRRAMPPWETEDIPRDQQIVRRR